MKNKQLNMQLAQDHYQPMRTEHRSLLERMVSINELIKRIVEISERVSLTALNASFVARKSGKTGVGFTVVTHELRAFSQRLTAEMSASSMQIFELVGMVAQMTKGQRLARHLLAAQQISKGRGGFLQPVAHGKRRRLVLDDDTSRQCGMRLAASLRMVGKRCDLGLAIARSAKVEAAYGGLLQGELAQVADDLEAAIVENQATLRLVQKRLLEMK